MAESSWKPPVAALSEARAPFPARHNEVGEKFSPRVAEVSYSRSQGLLSTIYKEQLLINKKKTQL